MTSRRIPLRPIDAQDDEVSRRTFVKVLGATMLAASGAACAGPTGEIVPYVMQPPEVTPGIPIHFATAMELDGYATGLVVESREGRPVKIEGNPEHPASLGASGVYEQAALLQLYDPDRAKYVTRRGSPQSWIECTGAFSEDEIVRRAGNRGDGLVLLLEPTASPTSLALIDRLRARFPGVRLYFYAPLAADVHAGIPQAPIPIYDFSRADVVLAVGADPAGSGPFHLRYAGQIAERRRVRDPNGAMSRVYAVEARYTPTGITADHRLAARPSEMVPMLATLRAQLSGGAAQGPHAEWLRAVAADLAAHHGRALVVAGDRLPADARTAAVDINRTIGAEGSVVSYIDPVLPSGDGPLIDLVDRMRGGAVQVLVVLGGNPAYATPADLEFAEALAKVPLSLYSGLFADETAARAEWFVPAAHFLESWGDARALDGTASIVQPLIAPLYGGRSTVDVLAMLAGDGRPSHEIVRATWAAEREPQGTDAWHEALRIGIVAGSASRPGAGLIGGPRAGPQPSPATVQEGDGNVEIAYEADPSVYDGRFANNPWLQELPDPVSKVTWDNAAFMSAKTAARLGIEASQVVALTVNGRTVQAPVYIEPGVADDLVVLPFGYGRAGSESRARGVGVNAYALWTSSGYSTRGHAARADAFGLPLVHEFAVTQVHWALEGRPIVLSADLERFRREPHFTAEHKGPVPALYGAEYRTKPQWAMAIDLTLCTGCNACMVACQAENNVPVVGKHGVQQRREMYWLRIDRYVDAGTGGIDMQPMLCQQCEEAPCEYVCPVNATVHSEDGLNEMVYNRCVGTRFCSNNCPYKVRRFNFFNYTSEMSESEKMAMNPDVTVRARGVMEKCTFCVQRIRRAEIDTAVRGSTEPMTDLQTACQQACPSRAIVFGSIADAEAQVARDARADQSYRVLNDQGTRPRIFYLARLRNTNGAIPKEPA